MTVDSTAVGSDLFEYRKTVIRNRRGGVFGNIGGCSVVHASGIADYHRFRSVRRQKDGGHSYVSDDNPLRCVLGIHRRSFLSEVPGKDRISDIILCGVYDTMHSVVFLCLRVWLHATLRGWGWCRIGSFPVVLAENLCRKRVFSASQDRIWISAIHKKHKGINGFRHSAFHRRKSEAYNYTERFFTDISESFKQMFTLLPGMPSDGCYLINNRQISLWNMFKT